MARTPFKLRSGNASAFKNLGSSPVKQDAKQTVTKGFSKNIHNPGPTTKVTTTTPTGTSHVETSNKTGRVLSEGKTQTASKTTAPKNFNTTGSKASTTPTWDPTKRQDVTKYVKGTKAYKAANPSTLSKVAKVGGKVLKKGFKALGGKALGVAGMLMATSSNADQPKKGKGKKEYPGGKIDFTKRD